MTYEIRDPAFWEKTDIELQTEKYIEDLLSIKDWKISEISAHGLSGIPYKVKVFITIEGPVLDGMLQRRVLEFDGNAAPKPYNFKYNFK